VLRSLFSGITGLRQHQTLMDVVSNNVANVNTVGFKSSSVVFQDTLSQMVKAAGAPGNGTGGINPAQVGLGVQLGAISTNFGQGSAQSTGKSTDLMIQGDGFFVVRSGQTEAYTRAGSFSFDTNGRLTNPEGMVVQGWLPDPATGVLSTSTAPTDVILPAGTLIPPQKSSAISLSGNITASSATNDTMTLTQVTYDATGKPHPLTIKLTNDGSGTNTYSVDITDQSDGTTGTAGSVTFDATGAITVNTPPDITLNDGAGTPTLITFDLTKVTRYGGPQSLNVSAADGYAAGSLQGFQISADGTVTGLYSNGQKLSMAKIALANFNNPMGLEKAGGSTFRATVNSGNAQINAPGNGGVGTLLGGSVEMSNVDLAQEFTNLIIAQRGFQANSRVITTSDSILQDLVDLKR
jgi:flagellar hook protein FlgE